MSREKLALRTRLLSGLERYAPGTVLSEEDLRELSAYVKGDVELSEGVLRAQRGSLRVSVVWVSNDENTLELSDTDEDEDEWGDEVEVDHDHG